MSGHLIRVLGRQGIRLSQRAVTASSVRAGSSGSGALTEQERRRDMYPRIGDREIVGAGIHGEPHYEDRHDYPMPAMRFMNPSPDILALQEKEKGDWKSLTLEEKKALYRATFRQTFSEFNANTGEWKVLVAGIIFGLAATGWVIMMMKRSVYGPLPHTITPEWQEAQMQRMIAQGQGFVQGPTADWDYEKEQWKK